MQILIKLLVLVSGFAVGISCVKYNYQITQLFGHNSLAEQVFGSGGTYTMWKLLGLTILLGTVWYVFR